MQQSQKRRKDPWKLIAAEIGNQILKYSVTKIATFTDSVLCYSSLTIESGKDRNNVIYAVIEEVLLNLVQRRACDEHENTYCNVLWSQEKRGAPVLLAS